MVKNFQLQKYAKKKISEHNCVNGIQAYKQYFVVVILRLYGGQFHGDPIYERWKIRKNE